MKCKKCGTMLPEGMIVCPNCGYVSVNDNLDSNVSKNPLWKTNLLYASLILCTFLFYFLFCDIFYYLAISIITLIFGSSELATQLISASYILFPVVLIVGSHYLIINELLKKGAIPREKVSRFLIYIFIDWIIPCLFFAETFLFNILIYIISMIFVRMIYQYQISKIYPDIYASKTPIQIGYRMILVAVLVPILLFVFAPFTDGVMSKDVYWNDYQLSIPVTMDVSEVEDRLLIDYHGIDAVLSESTIDVDNLFSAYQKSPVLVELYFREGNENIEIYNGSIKTINQVEILLFQFRLVDGKQGKVALFKLKDRSFMVLFSNQDGSSVIPSGDVNEILNVLVDMEV